MGERPLYCIASRTTRAAATCVAVLVACLTAVPTAHANQELTISPLIIDLDLKAGVTHVEPITATASGDEPIVVELVHADFGFGDDYGVVLINDDAPETTSFSTRGWFSLPKDQYRIPAGQSRQLPLKVSVPKNTPGGTYLGAALLRIVPPDSEDGGSQVRAVPQSGPLVFIAVAGGDPPKPKLETFSVPDRQGSGPIKPKIVVGNSGDEYFTVEGTVRLTGPGKTDETVQIRRQYVVPDEPRTLQAASEDATSDAGPPKLGTSKLGFGKYTVTTKLRIEPTGAKLERTRTVWIIPAWVWFLGILAALAFAASAAFVIRWLMLRRDAAALAIPIAPSTTTSVDEPDEESGPDPAPHIEHRHLLDEDSFEPEDEFDEDSVDIEDSVDDEESLDEY
ncbi:MAG: hypothetical protein KDC46_05210 [Thermoleophilia bacterium]|nr:hypothetical protein [Thermoleophilia bacterium]